MSTSELKIIIDTLAGLGVEAKQAAYVYFGVRALDSIFSFIIIGAILWMVRWAILFFSGRTEGLRRIAKLLGKESESPDFDDVCRWIEYNKSELRRALGDCEILEKSHREAVESKQRIEEKVAAIEDEVVSLRARLLAAGRKDRS